MDKYKRKVTIQHLIESIFGRKSVGFEKKTYQRGVYGEVIIGLSDTFDNFGYTYKYRNKYDMLFDITFNTSKCKFWMHSTTVENDFTREKAIDKAIEYFKEFDICVPEYFENAHDKRLFSKLIYKLISTELLPAIFNTDENRKQLTKIELHNEDITPDFTIAINNIKAVLESKDIVSIIYRNAKMSDIETIYGKGVSDSQKEGSLVTCICTKDIVELVYEPWFFEPSIEMYIEPKPYEIHNSGEMDFNISIEQLKKLSLLMPIDDEEAFDFPNERYTKQRAVDGITINCLSNTASFNFLPRYFYYAPELDQYSSEFCEKNNLRSEVTVYQNMRRNAAEALREKYRADFKKYYVNVLDSIITNTDMLASVDYDYLLSGNRCEKAELAKALGTIGQNINKLYEILYDGDYEDSEIKALIIWIIMHSVSMLNNAIEGIIVVPHRIRPGASSRTTENDFITQLRDYVSKYDIREFVTNIEAYFGKLQQVEELFESNNSDVCSRIEELDAFINIEIKTDFNKTKKKLSELDLDESVFQRFHHGLIKLTSVLKGNNNAPA